MVLLVSIASVSFLFVRPVLMTRWRLVAAVYLSIASYTSIPSQSMCWLFDLDQIVPLGNLTPVDPPSRIDLCARMSIRFLKESIAGSVYSDLVSEPSACASASCITAD